MTDPLHLPDHAWNEAEVLVERVELSARSNISPSSFFDDLASGLRLTSGASTVAIGVADRQQQSILSRSGISIHDGDIFDFDDCCNDHAPRCKWTGGESSSDGRLIVLQQVHQDVQLGIALRFDRPVELSAQKRLSELVEVVLGVAVTVFARSQLNDLCVELQHQTNRDQLISRLNSGIALTDSFASITAAIASDTTVDRVSLLRFTFSRYRLIATSTQSKIDRRARQARLLQGLVETTLGQSDRFTFTVGAAADQNVETGESLHRYLHESGCRQIHIESVGSDAQGDPVAAIVLERFRLPSDDGQSIESLLDPIRQPVVDAVRGAVERDDAGWGLIASRFASETIRRRASFVVIGMCAVVLAFCWIPATLKIPVEGRVVAERQSRIYAPAEGIVVDVLVSNGQHVNKGQTLVTLRSPHLDLQLRSIEGDLLTARTRLGALLAVRSRSGGVASRERESNVSADEQVLKAEVQGLEKQLQLIESQQAALVITSPIDGRIDRWDLQQALTARPVTHGQYLVSVNSDEEGWVVQLDLPEENVNYVLDQQQQQACHCVFRLRSNPTKTHEGTVEQIADVAHLDPAGRSVVRVTVPLDSDTPSDFRGGATVTAQIHSGQRSIGFVWLRGLIQWCRNQAWY